jgi:hypothetical protein
MRKGNSQQGGTAMWVPWSEKDAIRAEATLRAAGDTRAADAIKRELDFRATPAARKLRDVVRDAYGSLDEGELDIDDKVAISESDDGAYVLAWLWLTNDQLSEGGHDNGTVVDPMTSVHDGRSDEVPDGG